MSQFDVKMNELADKIKSKNTAVTGKLSVQGMIEAVNGITIGAGGSTVKFGYWTKDGKFQQVDLSGEAPVDSGEPIAVDAVMFKTGQPEPEYPGSSGGSGEMQFYLCTSYEGVVEKIIVTAGAITDEMEEPVSLVGEYTIVDPAAVGTDRRWYCPQTTASGDYPAYTYGVTIGCVNVDTGNWDENDNPIYEKYWAFAPGTYIDEWSYWLSSQTEGLESPFLVQDWQGYGGTLVTAPMLTSEVEDVAPYGATGWRGRPIVMTDKPVFFSYGAKLKNANGFWEKITGDGLTIESQWQLIGSNSVIKDRNKLTAEYHNWGLYGDYPGNPYGILYSSAGDNWSAEDIKHPSQYAWGGSSDTNPAPTFVYSETGGYFPAETVVSGLTYNGKPPEIGGFYNADATIKAERFFPA